MNSLGDAVVPLEDLRDEQERDLWLHVYPKAGKRDPKIKGQLHLTLKFHRLDPHVVTMSDFKVLRVLGRGNYGKVVLVEKVDSREVFALKVLRKKTIIERREVHHALAEQAVLQRVGKHPFIVQLYYSFQTEHKLFLVMELVNGGELFRHLQVQPGGRFTEDMARFYIGEVALALGFLHKHGVVYRDLKPENVMMDAQGHLRLTDFGLCKENMEDDAVTNTFCGTAEYMAPEVLIERPYTRAVDWWALGILLYELVVGVPPFYDKSETKTYHAIKHGKLMLPGTLSKPCMQLLVQLLVRNPAKRLGAGSRDVEEIMEHPFFEGMDWDALLQLKISPPLVPDVAGPLDTRFFDVRYTAQDPRTTTTLFPAEKEGQWPHRRGGHTHMTESDARDEFAEFTWGDPALHDGNPSNVGVKPPVVDEEAVERALHARKQTDKGE